MRLERRLFFFWTFLKFFNICKQHVTNKSDDMKYSLDDEAIAHELKCQYICFEPLIDPYLHGKCGVTSCLRCLKKCEKCPVCLTPFKMEEFFRNIAISNLVGKLQVECNQCKMCMDRDKFFESHLCPNMIIQKKKKR